MRATVGVAVTIIITAASGATAWGQSLKAQVVCAAQAERAYQVYKNAAFVPGFKFGSGDYQSHFNTKLNKCLILINQIYQYNGETMTTSQLSDAFERRVLANYSLNQKNNILDCELTPTLDKTANCLSRAEFDAFVAKYMEQ